MEEGIPHSKGQLGPPQECRGSDARFSAGFVLTGDLAFIFFIFFYFFLSYTVLLAPFLLRILNQSLTGECTRDKAETSARKQTLKMGL